MKAFALDEFGKPGSIHKLPAPEPAAGQVKVKIAAAGLNPFDASVASGRVKDLMEHRFPLVPGTDGSGTVEAIGEGITEWSVGDDVFGSVGKTYLGEGTLAEFTTLAAGAIARKPSSLTHAEAAAIPVAGVTALIMADSASLEKGDVSLVNYGANDPEIRLRSAQIAQQGAEAGARLASQYDLARLQAQQQDAANRTRYAGMQLQAAQVQTVVSTPIRCRCTHGPSTHTGGHGRCWQTPCACEVFIDPQESDQ